MDLPKEDAKKLVISQAKIAEKLYAWQLRGLQQPSGDQGCGYYALWFCTVLGDFLGKIPTVKPESSGDPEGSGSSGDSEKGASRLSRCLARLQDRKSYEAFRSKCLAHLLGVVKEKITGAENKREEKEGGDARKQEGAEAQAKKKQKMAATLVTI